MDQDHFSHLFRQFASGYPTAIFNGRVPPATMSSYYSVLGSKTAPVLAKTFRQVTKQGHQTLPAAGVLLAAAESIEKNSLEYSRVPQQEPRFQLPDQASGDGLPPHSRVMAPQSGRTASDYSEAAHDAADHFLNLIRAMKFKGLPGGEMADKFISEMQKQGPIKSAAPARYQERVRKGCIPNAADATCAAFAGILEEIARGKLSGDQEPSNIGGRLFWTFSGRQKQHIAQRMASVRAERERKIKEEQKAKQTSTDARNHALTFNDPSGDASPASLAQSVAVAAHNQRFPHEN